METEQQSFTTQDGLGYSVTISDGSGTYDESPHPTGVFSGEIMELKMVESTFVNDKTGQPETKKQLLWTIQSDTKRQDGSPFRLFQRTSIIVPNPNSGLTKWLLALGGQTAVNFVISRRGVYPSDWIGRRVTGFVTHEPGRRDPSKVFAKIAGCQLVEPLPQVDVPASMQALDPSRSQRVAENVASAQAQASMAQPQPQAAPAAASDDPFEGI